MSVKLFEVTVRGEAAGEATGNVLHMTFDGSASDLCDIVYTNWLDTAAALTAQAFHYTSATAKEVAHLLLDPDYYTKVLDVTSPGANDQYTDPQLAGCFSLHTGYSGRKRRGRFFQPGIQDSWVQNGKITGAGFTSWQNWANATKTALSGLGVTLVVFSPTIFASLTDIILDSYKPVTSITLNNAMSTMRTRKPA